MPVLKTRASMSKANSPTTDADALYRALKRLPPRTEQLLLLRFVDGLSDAECAERYGIAERPWAVHLLRSAKLFALATEAPGGPPLLPMEEPSAAGAEEADAAELVAVLERLAGGRQTPGAAALESPIGGPEAPEVAALVAPLRALRERAFEVRQMMTARAREELASPRFRRNEWLRRAALVVLIGAALWLYREELLALLPRRAP